VGFLVKEKKGIFIVFPVMLAFATGFGPLKMAAWAFAATGVLVHLVLMRRYPQPVAALVSSVSVVFHILLYIGLRSSIISDTFTASLIAFLLSDVPAVLAVYAFYINHLGGDVAKRVRKQVGYLLLAISVAAMMAVSYTGSSSSAGMVGNVILGLLILAFLYFFLYRPFVYFGDFLHDNRDGISESLQSLYAYVASRFANIFAFLLIYIVMIMVFASYYMSSVESVMAGDSSIAGYGYGDFLMLSLQASTTLLFDPSLMAKQPFAALSLAQAVFMSIFTVIAITALVVDAANMPRARALEAAINEADAITEEVQNAASVHPKGRMHPVQRPDRKVRLTVRKIKRVRKRQNVH